MKTRSPKSATRDPQLDLRIDAAAPEPDADWRDGATVAYRGDRLRIALDIGTKVAVRDGGRLCLPLPPEALPRQIRDRAEAWLRDEALRLIGEIVARKSALAGRRPPALKLSFASRASWAEIDRADTLRCNWRLVEQGPAVMEQVLDRALRQGPAEVALDLFALPA